jgi:hypothetical protein
MRPHPPRFALVMRPYNRLALVVLSAVDRAVAQGAVVIAREDEELCRGAADDQRKE